MRSNAASRMMTGAVPRIGRASWCGALLATSIGLATNAQAQAQTRAAAAAALARANDAVVTVVAYREGSTAVTSGVGVRVSDGRVVTALRHLRGASRAEVFGADGVLLGTFTTLEQAEGKLDLAVFARVAGTGPRLILSRRSAVLAQKVTLLGPMKGSVRSAVERTVTHVEPDDSGRSILRLGAPLGVGMAGSPVVSSRGELIALAVGTIAGREDGDIAIDVSAVRELLARPAVRLAFPARDGSIAAARGGAPEAGSTAASRSTDAATRPRASNSVFPERYGALVGADTARAWAIELFGCFRLESRQKVYCYLRVTNLSGAATFAVSGADLADSTRRKVRAAENLLVGETVQRVSGWRTKAEIALRELESARVAVEFPLPGRDSDAVRLMVDVSGERALWFGPFVLQRAP